MDQVTPPLVIDLDNTWDTKVIHGTVRFPQPGASSGGKKSIKLCFCQRGIQPNIEIIFWLTGRSIAYFDK